METNLYSEMAQAVVPPLRNALYILAFVVIACAYALWTKLNKIELSMINGFLRKEKGEQKNG